MNRIFFSPHPDDIAYSCFGTLYSIKCNKKEDLIVSVFTKTNFGGIKGTGKIEETSEMRKNEDKEFCEQHGCDYISLDYEDACLWAGNSEMDVYSKKPEDNINYEEIKNRIGQILEQYPNANIYVPLACRNHVDHRTVRDIVVDHLKYDVENFNRLFFYEDLPYANTLSNYQIKKQLEDILRKLELNLKFENLIVDIDWCWNPKVKAFNTYASQRFENVLNSIAMHAEKVGEGFKAERLWILTKKDSRSEKNFAWLSWEAARKIGGISNVIRNIQINETYNQMAHRTILIGPMYMPLNVTAEQERETIEEIVKANNSYLLYFNGKSRHVSLSKGLSRKLMLIEQKYGVSIAYMREYAGLHTSQTVERILIDLSFNITSKEIYSLELKYFLRDLEKYLDISIHYQPKDEKLFETNDVLNIKGLREILDSYHKNNTPYRHLDNDVIYGLLIAQPAIESLKSVLSSNEICILNVMDYFSLPTGYAALLERYYGRIRANAFKNISKEDYQIRVNYIASEIKPIRNIIEGFYKYKFKTPENGYCEKIIDSDVAVRSLIRRAVNPHHSGERFTLTEISGFNYIWEHVPLILLQNTWKLDYSWGISHHVIEDLFFLSRDITKIGYLPHGNTLIECKVEEKRHYKAEVFNELKSCSEEFIKFYNIHKASFDSNKVLLSIHIARPERCKRLDRDIELLRYLSQERHCPIVHLFIGNFSAGYNEGTYQNLKNQICGLSDNNICALIINNPSWPNIRKYGGKELNRRDLFVATDINLGISSYDSYGLAPLETLSCGAVSVISDSSGSAKHLEEVCRNRKELFENIVIVKLAYQLDWSYRGKEEIEHILAENNINYFDIETNALKTAAKELNHKLPRNEEDTQNLIVRGREISKLCSWNNVLKELMNGYSQLFEKSI